MQPSVLVAVIALGVVLTMMLGELRVSRAHEREMLRRGAIVPPDPAYATMRWSYPVTFFAMAVEGAVWGNRPGLVTLAGIVVFVAAKALKFWAIASLGPRWSYRVLVIPDLALVEDGPYRWLRHPNYVGVIGELAGMALVVQAPVTGLLSMVLFWALLRQRIIAEEHALGRS